MRVATEEFFSVTYSCCCLTGLDLKLLFLLPSRIVRGALKMLDMKLADQCAGYEIAGREIARHEHAGHENATQT